MKSNQYSLHEIIELRELSNFKWSSLIQMEMQLNQVENAKVKDLLEESIQITKQSLLRLHLLLIKASETFLKEGTL